MENKTIVVVGKLIPNEEAIAIVDKRQHQCRHVKAPLTQQVSTFFDKFMMMEF